VHGEPDALARELPEEGPAEAAIPSGVGREEACAAAGAHPAGEAALHERAVQARELAQAAARAGGLSDARPVEVHQPRPGAGGLLAQEHVRHLEVGVAAARVVEAPEGAAGRRGGPQEPLGLRLRGEEGQAVGGALHVDGAHGRAHHRAAAPRHRHHRLRHRRAAAAQDVVGEDLGAGAAVRREAVAQERRQPPAVPQRPQVEARPVRAQRQERARAAPPRGAGRRAAAAVRLQRERADPLLPGRGDERAARAEGPAQPAGRRAGRAHGARRSVRHHSAAAPARKSAFGAHRAAAAGTRPASACCCAPASAT